MHGDDRINFVTDTTPITSPTELIAWRPAHEQAVITNPVLNGIVIRPSLLYGRSASILSALFRNAYNGKVSWYGTPGGRYAVIHADDLAAMYVLVAEKATIATGKIFDAANSTTESVDELLAKLVVVSGAKGPYEYVAPSTRTFPSFCFRSGLITHCSVRNLYYLHVSHSALPSPRPSGMGAS